jgi:gliding motility-associated-like protein
MPLVGKYTFKAVVIHPCIGRSDTVTRVLEVIDPLTPTINLLSLSGDQVCEGAPIRLRSEVKQAGDAFTIEYLQGNTVFATQNQDGEVQFTNTLTDGDHTFSARLIPRTSCLSIPAPILSNNIKIKVNPKPRLSCTNPTAVNLGQDISFQTTVLQGKAPFNYEIDLGNGQKLNGSSATTNLIQKARYGNTGTFSAVIKVSDANGCSSECTVTVTVNPTSTAGNVDFQATTPTEGCESVTVTFISTTTGSQYQWDFGNGQRETTKVATVNHTYTATSNGQQIFDVSLTVLDNNGSIIGTKTIANLVKVYQKPTAVIHRSNMVACTNEPILFSNGGKGGISCQWDFGDGNTSDQSALLYQYKNPGIYTVRLMVIGMYNINNKCQAIDQITVTVNAKPDVDFTADKTTVCNGDAVTFTAQIIANGSSVQTVRWGLGDGQAQIGNPLTYNYWNTGTYTIQLNVITADGCTTLVEKKDYIIVETRPEVSMEADGKKLTNGSELEVQAGEPIAFKALTTNADAVRWEESGKTVSNESEPSLSFTLANQPIPLKLVAVKGSCEEALTVLIKVAQNDAISIPNAFTPNGDGVNDVYNIILRRPARFTLEIKDRWGTEVYKGNESSAGWNGGVNNKLSAPCPEGAYVYYLHLSYTNSKNQLIDLYYSGTIVIIR